MSGYDLSQGFESDVYLEGQIEYTIRGKLDVRSVGSGVSLHVYSSKEYSDGRRHGGNYNSSDLTFDDLSEIRDFLERHFELNNDEQNRMQLREVEGKVAQQDSTSLDIVVDNDGVYFSARGIDHKDREMILKEIHIPAGEVGKRSPGSSEVSFKSSNITNQIINLIDDFLELVGFSRHSGLEDAIPDEITKKLDQSKYGHEVKKHIQNGDRCLVNDLYHNALSSYIHAFEWAAIDYLEDNCGVDIISDEKEHGNYYNFAKGNNAVMDKLDEHVDLDQKNISKLESYNRAERRWMAHHKSGQIVPKDVEALRERFTVFLKAIHK